MRGRHGSFVGLCFLTFAEALTIPSPAVSAAQSADLPAQPPRTDDFGDPLPGGVFYRLGTTRLRHSGLQGLIFSADGNQVLTHGGGPELRVWDVATGKLVRRLPVPHNFDSLIASPNDLFLAGAWKDTVYLLDKADGKHVARWQGQAGWYSLAFTRDGKTLVGLSADLAVHRWEVASRKETGRQPLLGVSESFHEAQYRFWRLTPDGAVAAGKPDWDSRANKQQAWGFWDTVSGKKCRPALMTRSLVPWYLTHPQPWLANHQWCFSPDGKILAMAGPERWPEVWDTATGQHLPWDRPDGQIGGGGLDHAHALAFHPGGKLLALGHSQTMALRDLTTGKQLWEKEALDTEKVTVLAFGPDGKTLGVGSADTVRLLETATGLPTGFSRRDPGRFENPSGTVHFDTAGLAFQTQHRGQISVRDTATGKALRDIPGTSVVAASADGAMIAVRDESQREKELRVFDLKSGKELWQSECYFAFDQILTSDGKTWPIVSDHSGTIELREAVSGRSLKKLTVSPPYIRLNYTPDIVAAFSADFKLAATNRNGDRGTGAWSWRSPIQIWDLKMGRKIQAFAWPDNWQCAELRFLPGGRRLVGTETPSRQIKYGSPGVAATNPELTVVWDVASGKKHLAFKERLRQVSPNGQFLALAKGPQTELRGTATGRLMATLPCPATFGFSPDSTLLAASDDRGFGLWETATGRLVRSWLDPTLRVSGVTFSPDGRTLVVTSADGHVLACDVTGLATAPGKIQPLALTTREVEVLWNALGGDDGARSHRAVWRLVAAGGQSVKALGKRVLPVQRLDSKRAAALIADLDHKSYAVREQAKHHLARLEAARPALQQALAHRPTLEVRMRVEWILARISDLPWDAEPWGAELLRQRRAVTVLEQIGTPEARQLLQMIAEGVSEARLTKAAQESLDRLAKRGG